MTTPDETAERVFENRIGSNMPFSQFRAAMIEAHPEYVPDEVLYDLHKRFTTGLVDITDEQAKRILARPKPSEIRLTDDEPVERDEWEKFKARKLENPEIREAYNRARAMNDQKPKKFVKSTAMGAIKQGLIKVARPKRKKKRRRR